MAAPADHASIPSPFREPRALMGTGPTPSWPTTANAACAHKQPSATRQCRCNDSQVLLPGMVRLPAINSDGKYGQAEFGCLEFDPRKMNFFLVARGRSLGWRYDVYSYRYLNHAFHPAPSAIRVKARQFQGDIGGAPAKVLLVDGPLLIDEERHQAGNAVSRGIGHERKPADHVAAHHIVDFAARGVRPLPGENLIVIALIGSPPLAFDGISFSAAEVANSPSGLPSSPDGAGQ